MSLSPTSSIGGSPEHSEPEDGKRVFRFQGRYAFVTWSKSEIECKDDFHQQLITVLPSGSLVYGGRELHEDGTPHYHAVIAFSEKKRWTDARAKLSIPGDTNAIRIRKPRLRQPIAEFLENTMSYCGKDGDIFGQRIPLEGVAESERKRKWADIFNAEDEATSWKLASEYDPKACCISYNSLEKAFSRKRVCSTWAGKEATKLPGKFRVPKLLNWWKKKYVDTPSWEGRPKSLVVIGDPLVGKSHWAESFGRPIVMSSKWMMESIQPGATHLVVNDVKPAAFGYGGQSHWRDVLGCQPRFNARDFQQPTRSIEWGLPCIWTCNFDNDPRKDQAAAQYIKHVSHVIEIRDRAGSNDWGKLYEINETEQVERDAELDEALDEARALCLNEEDEAIDVTSEFGI